MLYLKNWSYAWINCNFFSFFWFLISLVFYIKINIKKIQIHFSKFNTCTLIIHYISKSWSSLSKKDFKVAKFRLRYTPCHFFKKCPNFTVIFIGHRQLNNTYYCGPAGPTVLLGILDLLGPPVLLSLLKFGTLVQIGLAGQGA
jgi:hypothetical protein